MALSYYRVNHVASTPPPLSATGSPLIFPLRYTDVINEAESDDVIDILNTL
jgi:hypothetical protein